MWSWKHKWFKQKYLAASTATATPSANGHSHGHKHKKLDDVNNNDNVDNDVDMNDHDHEHDHEALSEEQDEEIEEHVTSMDDKDVFEFALQLNNERCEKSTMHIYTLLQHTQQQHQAQLLEAKRETEKVQAELKEVKQVVMQLHQLLLAQQAQAK